MAAWLLLAAAACQGTEPAPDPAPAPQVAEPPAWQAPVARRYRRVHVARGPRQEGDGWQAFHFVVEAHGAVHAGHRWREQLDGAWSASEEENRRDVGILAPDKTAEASAALGELLAFLRARDIEPPDGFTPAPGPPSAPHFWMAEPARAWRYIVVHHSAGGTGNAAEFHALHLSKGFGGLGYHFVIGNGRGSGDGQIEVGYRWTEQLEGAHAKNPLFNAYGIGICLVGNFEQTQPTAAQLAATRELIAWLSRRYRIGAQAVLGHHQVREGGTLCPGRWLEIPALLDGLEIIGNSGGHTTPLAPRK